MPNFGIDTLAGLGIPGRSGYRFENFDVVAGYRHLEWEIDDGDTIEDVNFSSPMLGFKTQF